MEDAADSDAKGTGIGFGLPALASALRGMATETTAGGGVVLRPMGQGFLNAVQWLRGQLVDENVQGGGAALGRFDAAYQAAGRGFNSAADVGDVAGEAGMVVAAGMLLYPYAKGIPDTQGPTLQPGTAWNPEGSPQAPEQLTNLPFQVITVDNEAQLIAAIDTVNASPGNYAIHIVSNIVLTSDLPAIEQPMGSVQVDGEGNFLSGQGIFRGFVADDTNVQIQNLTIENAVAKGGAGGEGLSGGGGGAGLGGGVLAVNSANVTLDNVAFTDDSAQGGSGGGHEAGGFEGNAGYGGGGGMGGAGAAGGAWQSSVGGIIGDTLSHIGLTQSTGVAYDGASGGGGGLGIAAGGGTTGAGSQSTIISGAGGGTGFDNGSSSSNDTAADGGGLGAQGTQGGFGGGGGGGSSTTLGGLGGYGGGGGGGGGYGGFGGGGGAGGEAGFGGGDGGSSGGGGGAGLGGGAFADGSSSITVEGGSFSGDAATGGQGAPGAGSGQGYGSNIFLAGDQVFQAAAAPGQVTSITGLTDQTGSGDASGQGGVATVVAEGGGTVVLSGTSNFSGNVVVADGTTLVLAGAQAAGSGNITFGSPLGTAIVQVDAAALSAANILDTPLSGMVAGDSVDLVGLSGATQVSVATTAAPIPTSDGQPVTQVTVSNGAQSQTLYFEGLNPGATFTVASDGQGGTMLTMTQTMPAPTGLSEQTSTGGVVTFSGMAQAGSTVTLYQVQGQGSTGTLLQLGAVTVGSDGQFSFVPGTQPDAGAGQVVALATDSYGNPSFLSDPVSLPANAGGSPPVAAQGAVPPAYGSIVIRVGTEAQLVDAINEANTNSLAPIAIEFTNNITLSGMDDLPALQDKGGVQIVGNGYTLQGDGNTRGFMVYGGNVAIDDLTISDMVARGGAGGGGAAGGGGGAGLGGGLMAAGNSNVTVDDVNFVNDSAIGGTGGPSAGTAGGGYGGGGGLGGAGGSALAGTSMEISGGGGGIGVQATGGNAGASVTTAVGGGIIAGAPSDTSAVGGMSGGANGGISGGGGAGGTETQGGIDGGGGGLYGLSGSDTSEGGYGSTGGWGGGGGGNATYGGDGGFGGGGGGDSNEGGQGGWGGGGGGGTPALSSTGASGGFGAGAGGSGTNNPADSGGGGGLGAGGAVFVEAGSSFTMINSNVSGDSVAAGQGESGGTDGQAYGSGIFIEGSQATTFEATAGQTSTISNAIADEAGSQSGATGSASVLIEGQGTVALDATNNTYTGGTVIAGGTLELGAAGAAGSGNITFAAGASATLQVDPAAIQGQALGNEIAGFSQGDSVDLAGLASAGGASVKVIDSGTTPAGTMNIEIGITGSGGQQEDLIFLGMASNAAFVATSDGHGGTTVTLAPSSSGAGGSGSSPAAGNASSLGSNDAQADLSAALQQTPPTPGAMPAAEGGAGPAAAGQDPTPQAAMVAVPGTDENHAIATAVQGSESNPSGHHAR